MPHLAAAAAARPADRDLGVGEVAGALRAVPADKGEGDALFLPLRRTEVSLRMTGGIVEAQVTQAFRNVTSRALEAVYLFPLPPDANVTYMEFRVGERRVRSEVLPRAEAQKAYAEARSEGKRAALLEQERPNMFTTSVANVLPGEDVEVSFRFSSVAQRLASGYRISFPMVVGPRYVGDGTRDADRVTAPKLAPNTDPGHRLSFQMRIAGVPVEEIGSPTHRLSWRKAAAAGQFEVRFRGGAPALPDSDLQIDIRCAEGAIPDLSVVADAFGEAGAPVHALATLFPPAPEQAVASDRDIVFVVDTSSSMSGQPLAQAKAGLLECLAKLRDGDRFNIVRYSNTLTAWSPLLRGATPEALAGAKGFVESLVPGGGTEMQPALSYALNSEWREESLPLVVLLTDGAVGNEDRLMRLLEGQLGSCRVFPIGIGSAPNAFLMREMAIAGRGEARFVRDGSQVQAEMASLFASLDAPVLTDIELHWEDAEGRRLLELPAFPKLVPDLFGGRPLQVSAKLPVGTESGTVELRGRRGGEKFSLRREFKVTPSRTRGAIATLFGRAQIDALMRERVLAPARRAEIGDAIRELGLEYQLVTEFTARVAVDQVNARAAGAPLDSRRVPLPLPRGVVPAARPAAAPAQGGDPRLLFPKPMFVGTPIAVRAPNLDKSPARRFHLNAPPEAKLLSRGAKVTASDPEPIIGDLAMVTDGDKDGGDGSYVELGPGMQWVQIDLGGRCQLFGIVLWHFHKNARAYEDVVVQISDDPEFKTGVTTIFNNDHDNSAGLGIGADLAWIETNHGRIIDVPGRKARYIRLYSNGNSTNELNHYVEVEVFGLPRVSDRPKKGG